jgi:hypothetical protein
MKPAPAPQVANSGRERPSLSPVHPNADSIRRLHQAVGNQAVARLLAAGLIQPQLKISRPDTESERGREGAARSPVGHKALDGAFPFGNPSAAVAGESERGSSAGNGPPAHELTHFGQQGMAPGWESQPAASLPLKSQGDAELTRSVILDDGAATVASGEMKRADFLAALEQELCSVADDRLSAVGRTAKDCPYLRYMFRFYAAKDVEQLRRAILRHAPETEHAATAGEYISLLSQRVRTAVDTWVATGRIAWRAQGIEASDDPAVVQAELGPGQVLDAGIRSKAESAMQEDLSSVRVHTGEGAASMASRVGARAFTVGSDVAFAAGEYRPGTPAGDAMIAHELAHVVQQKGGGPAAAQQGAAPEFERDANEAAAGTMMALWGTAKGAVAGVARRVKPALRTGLRLQGCSEKGPLTFHPGSFTMDADGALRTSAIEITSLTGDLDGKGFLPGKALHVSTKEITSLGSAIATGGTNLEASAWQAGYIQTVFKVNTAATYVKRRGVATPIGDPHAPAEEKVFLGEAPDHTRDCVTDHVVDEPWYNDIGPSIGRFSKTEQSRAATFSDRPQFSHPTQTDDGFDLSRISGQHKFGTWFIVAKAAGGTPYFLNSATWEVNWAVSVTVGADGTPTATPSGGSRKTRDPISDSGPTGPQLTGTVTNDAVVRKWKTP